QGGLAGRQARHDRSDEPRLVGPLRHTRLAEPLDRHGAFAPRDDGSYRHRERSAAIQRFGCARQMAFLMKPDHSAASARLTLARPHRRADPGWLDLYDTLA